MNKRKLIAVLLTLLVLFQVLEVSIPVQASVNSKENLEQEVEEKEVNEITIIKTNACSGNEHKNTIDKNTDTYWTSKDKHTPDNIHFWECVFDKEYDLSDIVLTLGREVNGKWGFIPDNITIDILKNGNYEQVAKETKVSEVTTFTFPKDTTAEGVRLSFLDQKSKGFSIREVSFRLEAEQDDGKTPYVEKKVYADYHGPRYTREHDGNVGNWGYSGEAKNTNTGNKRVVKNADLFLENGQRDLAADAYPLVGMQSQMDADYQEYQILLAKMANIDGFFIEWGFPGHGTDQQLDTMMKVAEKYDFEIGINWCDAWHMKDWITQIKPDVVTREEKVEEAVNSLSTILDKLYASPVGALYDGHPLLYLFGGGFEQEEWNKISTEAQIPPQFLEKKPWYFRRASVSGKMNEEGKVDYTYTGTKWHEVVNGPFGWVPERVRNAIENNIPEFDVYGTKEDCISYLELLKQTFIADKEIPLRNSVVSPGMDNRSCAGWGDKYKYIDRESGQLYKALWEYNVQNRDYLDVVYIASWNDYTEGHQIEPTVEDGYRELLTTQEYAYQFKGEGNLDNSGIELPAKLFELRKKSEYLVSVGFESQEVQKKLDEAGLKISQAKYKEASALLEEAKAILEQFEQQVEVEALLCTAANGKITLEQGKRTNVTYHRPVTSNVGGTPELAVDGVSKTYWQYEGENAYLEIDLGKEANLVSGTILSDAPFELWYENAGEFIRAEIVLEQGFENNIGGDFNIVPSITTGKVRIRMLNNSGRLSEIKLFENRMPQVSIVTPKVGEQVDFTNIWEVCAEINDEDGNVEKVEVLIDDIITGPLEQKVEGNIYCLTMPSIGQGQHKIQVKVTDDKGAETITKPEIFCSLLENVSLNKPVKANSYLQNYEPERAVDGIISLESRWRTPSNQTEHWLEIDLQEMYQICRIDLYMGDDTGFAVRNFRMEYWEDEQWKIIPETSFTENTKKDLSLMFEPIKTDKVRFYSNEEEGRGVRLKEIEVYAFEQIETKEILQQDNNINEYNIKNGCYITLSPEILSNLSDHFYHGTITFSYLDEGNDAIKISGASNDEAQFGDFRTIAEIHKTNTGKWCQATVKFNNCHIVMTHEAENDSDIVIKGEGKVKDVSLEFTVPKKLAEK